MPNILFYVKAALVYVLGINDAGDELEINDGGDTLQL